jgi:hypothetical protein
MATALADDSTEDWPEPVYFPQTQSQPSTTTPAKPATSDSKKHKKGGWLAKRRENNRPPLTEDQITKVGPKDPPPSPYPLLRLPMPILTDAGPIGPGIYLVKPAPKTSEASPEAASSSPSSDISIILTRQDRVILPLKVHLSTKPDENMAQTGTPSPLVRTTPPAATVTHVEAQLAEDAKSITIVITENERRYESDPFPVNTDTRHVLTF